jgi:hypothetical protein
MSEHETIAAAYAAGGMAYLLGDPEQDCPHDSRREPLMHAAWRLGWTASERYQDRALAAWNKRKAA